MKYYVTNVWIWIAIHIQHTESTWIVELLDRLFSFAGVTFAVCDFKLKMVWFHHMQVLTVDYPPPHPRPSFQQKLQQNGNVSLAYCLAKGQ